MGMKYRFVTIDKDKDVRVDEVVLPRHQVDPALLLLHVSPADRGMVGFYSMTSHQALDIGSKLKVKIDNAKYRYILEPFS